MRSMYMYFIGESHAKNGWELFWYAYVSDSQIWYFLLQGPWEQIKTLTSSKLSL